MTIKQAISYSNVCGLKYEDGEAVEAVKTIEQALDNGYALIDSEKLIGQLMLYRNDAIPKQVVIGIFKELMNE